MIAALGLLGRWAIRSDAEVLAAVLWVIFAVAVGVWALLIDGRTRRMERLIGPPDASDLPLHVQARTNLLALDVAHLEARALVEQLGGESGRVKGDAVTLVAGARFARWQVAFEPLAGRPRLQLTPPPWVAARIKYGFLGPVRREDVDELGRFLAGHSVPVGLSARDPSV